MSEYFTLDLVDESATLDFGARFSRVIKPHLTIFLQGNLGAGKTTFVRGLLHGLGFEGKVKSPTYTILESYEINPKKMIENGLKLTVNHFDLYRFNDDEEWESAGFREAFNAQSVCLIEWPEKAIDCLAQADIHIEFSLNTFTKVNSVYQEIGRTVKVIGLSVMGKSVCEHL